MKAETFLADLNARYRESGGASLDLLARHVAEAIEEISEPKNMKRLAPRSYADSLHDLTNEQLREILAKRDLPTSGTKDELVARIVENPADQEPK